MYSLGNMGVNSMGYSIKFGRGGVGGGGGSQQAPVTLAGTSFNIFTIIIHVSSKD